MGKPIGPATEAAAVFHRPTREVAAPSAAALADRYRDAIATVVADADDVDGLAATTGVDAATLAALSGGDAPPLAVAAGARVLGTADRWPDAPAIAAGAREKLLVGAIAAVVDAEDLAARAPVDLTPAGVRRRLTGAEATTVAEFAALEAALATTVGD